MLLDIPTRKEYEALEAKIDRLQATAEAVHALLKDAPSADGMLSVEQVAKYTNFNRRTVEKWVEKGDWNDQGKRVYLPAYKRSGRLRFKRSEVDAFCQGVGVLEPSIDGAPPQPTKQASAAKQTKKTSTATASEKALRVA
jgi:excisionase family DNA binding protein